VSTVGGTPERALVSGATEQAEKASSSRAFVWIATLVTFVAAAAVRWPLLGEAAQDDSLITLRYAENIVSGQGFVYNMGERVLGTSTPLYTVLLALFGWCRLPMFAAGRWLNILADAAAAALLVRMLARGPARALAIPAALLYAFNGLNLLWAASGMETGIYVLLVTGALCALAEDRFLLATSAGALATLTRPDGVVALAIVIGSAALRRRRLPWREALVGGAVLAPWLLFATWYFGSPLPHSALIKLSFYRQHFAFSPVRILVAQYFGAPTLFLGGVAWAKVLHFALALVGLLLIASGWRHLWAFPVYLALFTGALVGASTLLFPWYLAPLNLPLTLLAALGCLATQEAVRSHLSGARRDEAATAVGSLLILSLLIPAIRSTEAAYRAARQNSRDVASSTQALGTWLSANAGPSAVVCAGDIGYIGYYSRRRILDYVGLVSPEVDAYNRSNQRAEIVRDFRPDFVAMGTYDPLYAELLEARWFRTTYELVPREYRSGSGVIYALWQRRE
jgi:hypothetical protein